ncbi:MAG: hypothetical protein M1438_13230 [Deltaproteobacteria bacterium]|nr:hypothetical protein [Deltaproteobacteria bacterium]
MKKRDKFLSEVLLNGQPLADFKLGQSTLRDRYLLKEFLDCVHLKKGLLEPYSADYPLVEPRELLPSFEKNFAEYQHLPSFSMVAFNRPLSYQDEIFQFDLLHPLSDGKKRGARENLDKILPHLDRDLRNAFRARFANRDLTDLAHYEEVLDSLFHMDRAHVIAREAPQGDFRLLGVYASFPSDLDTELKALGRRLGKFKSQDSATYEREREFIYQFLMEIYGFPIASERRTSAALFARKLSRLKEQYLVKVLGASDRTITSLSGLEQKQHPLVEKTALISLPLGLAEANPHLGDQGFYVDPRRRVVIFKVTYQQHKYNRFNVLEDRALSVVKQELIHPVHGGRESGLNILKDSRRSLKELTDIVRGEHLGSISYGRSELITGTKTHEERLKFLSAWLAKNMRRLGRYRYEGFEAVKKVLNSYLLNREYREAFAKHEELHREVLHRLAYLTQAQRLQPLEKLVQFDDKHRAPSPARRLTLAVAFLEAIEEELIYFYPDLFTKCLSLWEELLHYPYFRKLAHGPLPPASPYRRRVWETMDRGRNLIAELRREHDRLKDEVLRGTPFPLLKPKPPQPPSPTG